MEENDPRISLSPRLTSVCELLMEGLPRKAIAIELGLSIHTVNGYVKQIYAIFRVRNQVGFFLEYGKFKKEQ